MLPVWLELRAGGPNEPSRTSEVGSTPFDFLRAWFPVFGISVDRQVAWKSGVVDGLLTLEGRFGTPEAGVDFRQVNPVEATLPNHNRLATYGLRGADLVWEYRLGPLADRGGRTAYRGGRLLVRFDRDARAVFEKRWETQFRRKPVFGLAPQPRSTTVEIHERFAHYLVGANPILLTIIGLPEGEAREYVSGVIGACEAQLAIDETGEHGAVQALAAAAGAERLALDLADIDLALRSCFPETAEAILLRYAGASDEGPTLDHARELVERAVTERHPDVAEDLLVRVEQARRQPAAV